MNDVKGRGLEGNGKEETKGTDSKKSSQALDLPENWVEKGGIAAYSGKAGEGGVKRRGKRHYRLQQVALADLYGGDESGGGGGEVIWESGGRGGDKKGPVHQGGMSRATRASKISGGGQKK